MENSPRAVQSVVCVSAGVYREALTRGRRYEVVDRDDHQVRVKGDNGRARWFPAYHFAPDGTAVPMMTAWRWMEGPGEPGDRAEDVVVDFDDGASRWCTAATPAALQAIVVANGHFWSPHLLVVDDLRSETVEAALREVEQEGELLGLTRSFHN